MFALFEFPCATRTNEVGWPKVDHRQLHGVCSSASGEGFPLIAIQPNPTASIALVDLHTELVENIHRLFTLRAFQLTQIFSVPSSHSFAEMIDHLTEHFQLLGLKLSEKLVDENLLGRSAFLV